jgi:serine/threonine-protein kinase
MGENGKERIGDYELIALIGDGAQGRVYRARCVSETLPHVKPGEEVALKVVRITGEDEKIRLKFQEQADILRRLSHTNIVSYRDCFAWHAGEWDEAQCLVMELLEGEPLNERLKKASSGLPWPQVEQIFEQCLAGLIHARERGITHRDLKPSNIFITTDGDAKLIDFDIARRDDSGQMSTAGWKGTFDYMAPDFISLNAFRGDEVSDIFSLGVCFYQALTGSLPYEPLGETAHIGYLNRWRNNAAPTPSFRPGVFRVLSNAKAFVTTSLTVNREERFASFTAMLEEFRKIRYRRIRHKNKDQYELLAVLGRGGFGEVFKARRVSDGLLVAVKYLFAEKQSDRFLKEAKILQQYPHPNLVKYVDFMTLEGTAGEKQFFLVMEFLEGMPGWTLRHRIKHEGRMEAAEAVPLFAGYLSALQFLHSSAKSIIHRDIKPGNLYAPMGQPEKGKIFDLGVARDVSGTVTVGGVPGTLDYMAPEFAEAGNDRGSPQSDLYALGLCLYEALVGKPVFERLPTDLNSAWLAFQDRLRKPPAIAFDADVFAQFPRLKPVLARALADRPEARFRSANDMRMALEDALKPEASHAAGDDAFDAGEVTMATFSGGAAHAPEPGATLGTRALDGTLSDAVGQLAASRRQPGSKARRLLLAGGGLAAVLALALGGAWFAKRGRNAHAATEQPAQPAASQAARAEPARPPETAAPKPVTDPAKRAADEAARLAAEEKAAQEARARDAQAQAEADRLAAAKAAAKRAEADKALADKAEADRLAAEKAEADRLAADKAEADRLAEAKAKAERAAREALAAQVADAVKRLDDLSERMDKGSLAGCADGVALLAGVTPDLLADTALKAKREATLAAYLGLLEKTIEQKDPLGQRSQRLATAGEVLDHPAAAALFGDAAARVRKALDGQKAASLLRLINHGANTVQVSASEIQKMTLLGGEAKEWLVPVSGETLAVSVSVDGGSRFLPRVETVNLPRAGGVERSLAALDVAPEKPAEPSPVTPAVTPPLKPAVTQVKPAVTPPAEPVTVPTTPAAKPAPEAAGLAAFTISVSPKTATVLVDDQPVETGHIEVTPNENHKVSVTCSGYKPVQQYYRAKPGETRKIDILLEKETKKSLFGF